MYEQNAQEIERIIRNQELQEILQFHSAKINAEISDFALSPTHIYCVKTGQPISQINPDTLLQTLQVIGREELLNSLYLSNCNAVHPLWVKTAIIKNYNDWLDRLSDCDPQGYVVYCLGLLASQSIRQNKEDTTAWAEYHWSLARAWQILKLLSKEQLSELCDLLCHFHLYTPLSARYLERTLQRDSSKIRKPDLLARLAISGVLQKSIEKAIDDTIAGIPKTESAVSGKDLRGKQVHETQIYLMYEEIAHTVNQAAKGAFHIRKQRKARKALLNDEIKHKKRDQADMEIEQMVNEFGQSLTFPTIKIKNEISGQSVPVTRISSEDWWRKNSWKHKLAKANYKSEAEQLAAIAALLNDDNITAPAQFGDNDENEPEMRRLSWEEIKMHDEARRLEREAQIAAMPKPKLDIFARLSAAKVTPIADMPPETPKLPQHNLSYFDRKRK